MGNRATVVFAESKNEKAKNFTGVYLHWNGGPESIYAFLDYMNAKGCRIGGDPAYATARFCQIVGNFMGGTLSLGCSTYRDFESAEEENGVYLVTRGEDGYKMHRFTCSRWLTDEEVEQEAKRARQHEYWQGDETIMQQIMKYNDPIFDRKD